MTLVSATPTAHFIAICKPCLRPVRVTDETVAEHIGHRVVTCPECSANLTGQRLYGTKIAAVCNSQCMGATGPSCSCQCGGENHGKAFNVYDSEMLHDSLVRYRDGEAKKEANRIKRAEAKARAERQEFDAWAAENAEVVEFLGDGSQFAFGSDDPNDFLYEMSGHTGRYSERRALTPNQAAAVLRCKAGRERYLAARAAREANAKPCPVGDGIEITGEIVKAWAEENPFTGGLRNVMTVRCDGYDVRATIPSAIKPNTYTANDCEDGNLFHLRGRRVTLIANVERHRKNDAFGYAKRPRKARLI